MEWPVANESLLSLAHRQIALLSLIIAVNPAICARDPMLTPDYKTFLQLSRDATLIPVAKTLSADMLTPVGAFQSIAAGQKYAFLLESVEGGEKIGRYTFVGTQPRRC